MSDVGQGLESLGEITGRPPGAGTEHIAITRERKVDKFGRAYATGKRKNAVARVWLKPGKGNITINGKTSDAYFARPVLRMTINQPFKVTEREGEFDVVCTVVGILPTPALATASVSTSTRVMVLRSGLTTKSHRSVTAGL